MTSLTAETPSLDDQVSWYLQPGHPSRVPLRRDPYPFFDRLRTASPVYKSPIGPWLITGYHELTQALRAEVFSRNAAVVPPAGPPHPGWRMWESGLLFLDPPEHTRLRRIVSGAFTQRALQRWRVQAEEIVRTLLDDLRGRDTFSALHDFALWLPARLICQILGLPEHRSADFLEWGQALVAALEPGQKSDEALARSRRAIEDAEETILNTLEERRRRPGEDVLSALVAAEQSEADPLTREEVVSTCLLMHSAGYETTGNIIVNGLYLLLRRPDDCRRLRANPDLVPSAVEEILRYESSAFGVLPRVMKGDLRLGDVTIPEGEVAIGILSAADRDPRVFEDPGRFDITRENNHHIAFGQGPHYCLGAVLGRLETQTAFRILFTEYPELTLVTEEPDWRDSVIQRAMTELEVAWA